MKAIILAAGFGKRLGYFTKDIPKASVCVASRPLIRYAVNFARHTAANQIIVVGGYKSNCIWEDLVGEEVVKVENRDYHKGNLYSLSAACEYMDDDFIQINVDHLYPGSVAHMIETISDGIWAFSDFDRPLGPDDMKIKITGNADKAYVGRISKSLDDYDGGYCGITVVAGSERADYLASLKNVLCRGDESAVVEDVFVELIRNNTPPKVYDISGTRWLEIDTPEDHANAERILRMKPFFLD
jgi:choline kinase